MKINNNSTPSKFIIFELNRRQMSVCSIQKKTILLIRALKIQTIKKIKKFIINPYSTFNILHRRCWLKCFTIVGTFFFYILVFCYFSLWGMKAVY